MNRSPLDLQGILVPFDLRSCCDDGRELTRSYVKITIPRYEMLQMNEIMNGRQPRAGVGQSLGSRRWLLRISNTVGLLDHPTIVVETRSKTVSLDMPPYNHKTQLFKYYGFRNAKQPRSRLFYSTLQSLEPYSVNVGQEQQAAGRLGDTRRE